MIELNKLSLSWDQHKEIDELEKISSQKQLSYAYENSINFNTIEKRKHKMSKQETLQFLELLRFIQITNN